MKDDFGYGIIAITGNYEGDLKRMAEVFNCWRLSSDSQFYVEEDRIKIDGWRDKFPSIYPQKITRHPEGYEEVHEGEEIDLRSVLRKISPWFYRGTIELSAMDRGESFRELLIIQARPYIVEWHYWYFDSAEYVTEKYDESMFSNFKALLHSPAA